MGLEADYFDGRTTRLHRVVLTLQEGRLIVTGDDIDLDLPFSSVRVDEKLGPSPRRLHFPGGALCVVRDHAGLGALLTAAGHRERRVDLLQRRLGYALAALVALILLAAAAYQWGVPWAASVGARHLPPMIGKSMTNQALKVLDGPVLKPSTLPKERQAALTDRFKALHLPEGGKLAAPLLFRRSPQLKANAFTLPDGTIVLLDDLVTLIGDDDQVMAVLAHELGHAHGHHGLQLLIQGSAVGAFWTFMVGDVSQLLAAAPTLLMQLKFSRELEIQADEYGAELLTANGLSPRLLADALQTLQAQRGKDNEISYLTNHPPTEDRIAALRRR